MHYLKTWFIIDLIQAIPYFSLIKFLEKLIQFNDKNYLIKAFIIKYNLINPIVYNLIIIKAIKVYKMFNYNSTILYYSEILSKNEIIDDYGSIILSIFILFCCLNMVTCLFIFVGRNTYNSWIIELNIQDESYLNIFIASIYFIIVTITTVGYGDITGNDMPEIWFQIFLLIVGTVAYSFIISYFSNYIVKNNKKSMTFEKNLEILQEIKVHHPNMNNSLYNEVLRNLYNEQLYEKKDKHLLFDCLPYSLKNKLIMEMYKPIKNNFVFFKDIDNADFIVKVITSFKPLLAIKNDIIIQEGGFVKEIIFVKKGIVGLNICINLNDLENSIRKYLSRNKACKLNIIKEKPILIPKNRNSIISLDKALNDSFMKQKFSFDYNNNSCFIDEIKIIEIRNNEHFGDALIFLNEPCPLEAKVRTKTSELLILRKMEAIEIYSIYPNIWKRINKKSLFNMEQIYKEIEKKIIKISNRYNIKIEIIPVKKIIKKKTIKLKRKSDKKDLENFQEKKESSNKRKSINDSFEKKIKNEKNQISDKLISKIDDVNMTINNEINKDEIINIQQYSSNLKVPFVLKDDLYGSFEYIKLSDSHKISNIKSPISNKSTFNKNIIYNSFKNLNIIKEKSFQLKSSYDNINKISNYKLIKDLNLQTKVKNYIINECSIVSCINTKKAFLDLPNSPKNKNSINSKNNSESRISDYGINQKDKLNKKLIKNNEIKERKSFSSNKIPEITNKKFCSSQNIDGKNLLKISNHVSSKNRRKLSNKKNHVNKMLNAISKNIQKTNESINNPNEFYMNFFNDIIQKSGYGEENEIIRDKEKKNNILTFFSGVNKEMNSNEKNEQQKSKLLSKSILDIGVKNKTQVYN